MNFRYLAWDSAFFSRRVAALDLHAEDADEALTEILSTHAYDCCYVFCDYPSPTSRAETLSRLGGECCDRKVTYRKQLAREVLPDEFDNEIESVAEADADLITLAVQSGWRSRFVQDRRLQPLQPELYRRWLDNCLNNEHSAVFAIRQRGHFVAMVCVATQGDCGKIQLIAVAKSCRGQGLGKKLMTAAETFFLKQRCLSSEVVTQLDNAGACRLYEQAGFAQCDIKEVWHVWKL